MPTPDTTTDMLNKALLASQWLQPLEVQAPQILTPFMDLKHALEQIEYTEQAAVKAAYVAAYDAFGKQFFAACQFSVQQHCALLCVLAITNKTDLNPRDVKTLNTILSLNFGADTAKQIMDEVQNLHIIDLKINMFLTPGIEGDSIFDSDEEAADLEALDEEAEEFVPYVPKLKLP